MEATPRTLRFYRTANGKDPFVQWLRGLRDARGRNVIRVRLNRIEAGNLSNCEPVGEGVHELKIDFGPGYRVYFGDDGASIILLLGGDKSSQASDIKKAKEYWRDYKA